MSTKKRMTLRILTRDKSGSVQEIREQEMPATGHEVALWLRRGFVREQVAEALFRGDWIAIERKDA